MTTQDFLDLLELVKKSGDGWSARCPAHDDRKPSLSVAAGEGDVPVFHCHAGCEQDAIIAALDVTWPEVLGERVESRNGAVIANMYPYVDEAGRLLFEAVRYAPKDFRQRRPDGSGGWIWNLRGVRRVLYRLPAVRAAIEAGQPVFVVEGEKDVHALEQIGLTATTNPMGAGKWRPEYSDVLRGAGHLYVVPDDDSEGRQHAAVVASSLVDLVEDVRVVEVWPQGESHADVADWLGDGSEPEQARKLLREIVARTPAFTKDALAEPAPEADLGPVPGLRIAAAEEFAAIDEPSAEPLLGDEHDTVLSPGGAAVFYGDGGAGKTTLEIDLICHLAAGEPWLGLPVPRPCKVLVIENEGPRGKFRVKLREKLAAWSGPSLAGRIFVLEEPWALFSFASEAHREALRALIEEEGFDVIAAGPVQRLGIQGGGTPEEVGAFILNIELTRARLERPVAVLFVHHENKAGDVAGAWEGVPDTLAHVQARGNGATRLYWQKTRWSSSLHGKSWTLLWREGQSFEIDETPERAEDDIAAAMIEVVRANPGASWNAVDSGVEGKASRKRNVRDLLIEDGTLVNVGGEHKFKLYVASDPVVEQLRPVGDAVGTHSANDTGSADESANASRVPTYKGTQGRGRTFGDPGEQDEDLDWR